MKSLKKVLSLILAVAMVLGMTITGFAADETYTISVFGGDDKNPADTHTYSVYQIFTGDLADGKLSNVKWGQNGNGTKGAEVSEDVLKELTDVANSTSDTAKLAVINKHANVTGTAYGEVTKDAALTNVPAGYYLIKDKDNTVAADDAATLYIVKVIGDVQIDRKASVPHVDKIINEDGGVKANSTSIGKKVPYQITGTMPDRIDDYNTYFYKFNDTLSKGLTYNNDIKVELVNGTSKVDVTKYFYKDADTSAETKETTIEVSIQDILQLRNATPKLTVNKDTTVVVTYSATLNEDALIVVDGNPNTVEVIYSNDPNNSGEPSELPPSETPELPTPDHPTGVTPKDEVITYTTELTILKTDEKNQFLPGTEFTLTGEGVKIALVTTTEFKENPAGNFYKLKNGTYTTAVPSTADKYDERTAGDLTVRGTVETPIYIKLENGEYKEVKSVPAHSTYYVKSAANTEDYASTTIKYSAETSVVAKGAGKTETDVTGTVGTDGKVTFTGLGAGKYTLTETKTMPGYNTIKPIDFEITFDAATKKFASDNETIQVETDNTLSATIVNKSGSVLPTTGGMGTTLFYLFGSILVLGAGVLLFTRKRMAR